MITKNQLIISCTFNGLNTIMFIYYIYDIIQHSTDLEHITRWAYYLNSIFTTICLSCDIILYMSQKPEIQYDYKLLNEKNDENYVEALNDWNRNKFSPICNSLSYFVLIGFWAIYLIGDNLLLVHKSVKSWFNSIYHHLIITIIIIIDLFVSNRKQHPFNKNYLLTIIGIYATYCMIIAVEKYYFGRNAYIFMKESSKSFLVLCSFLTMSLVISCYFIHIYLIKLKCNYESDKEDKEDSEKLLEDSTADFSEQI